MSPSDIAQSKDIVIFTSRPYHRPVLHYRGEQRFDIKATRDPFEANEYLNERPNALLLTHDLVQTSFWTDKRFDDLTQRALTAVRNNQNLREEIIQQYFALEERGFFRHFQGLVLAGLYAQDERVFLTQNRRGQHLLDHPEVTNPMIKRKRLYHAFSPNEYRTTLVGLIGREPFSHDRSPLAQLNAALDRRL